MLPRAFQPLFFKLGWDTRCRSLDVTRAIKPVLSEGQTLLDVGCGEHGLAEFIEPTRVVGTDITAPLRRGKERMFVRASMTSLPFADLSFPVTASVDVLEHLPQAARDEAVAELVRVARGAAVIAFPCGQRARQTDEGFQRKLIKLNRVQPDWLVEHLRQPYPSVESVISTIKAASLKYHRACDLKIFYSEHIEVTRLSRWAASRSGLMHIVSNLLAGLLISLVPRPDEENSYRAVILVTFQQAL